MIQEENVIIFDVDGTLCIEKREGQEYRDVVPRQEVIEKLREYKERGFYIILLTSRTMRTHGGNVGKITAKMLPVMMEWLDRHEVPYDEIHVGKPWQGRGGFYVDDKTIRPSEFLNMKYEEIIKVLEREK